VSVSLIGLIRQGQDALALARQQIEEARRERDRFAQREKLGQATYALLMLGSAAARVISDSTSDVTAAVALQKDVQRTLDELRELIRRLDVDDYDAFAYTEDPQSSSSSSSLQTQERSSPDVTRDLN
jgi:signal transduction histidine kinase